MLNVYVAGHTGMVGSAIARELSRNPQLRIVTRSRGELDLTNQNDVRHFFKEESIDQIYMAAAKVGGILANSTHPATFIYENLMIQTNLIHAAAEAGISRLLFLGSSCIYPKETTQPIKEEALLSGPLEPTNEPYAVAKIAGIKMCESYNRQFGISHGTDYRSVMPTNLYGPGDNYDLEHSHVIPGLIRRFHVAKEAGQTSVAVWGTGTPRREFLHVDDMARACICVMSVERDAYRAITAPMCSHINVGSGTDVTISEVAQAIAKVVGFEGDVFFDHSKPDGTPRKLMDSGRVARLGWSPSIELEDGLSSTYSEFLKLV
jgi:GDP-L-fucose synthase